MYKSSPKTDRKHLLRTIFPAICALWFVGGFCWFWVTPPSNTFVGLFDIYNDLSEPTSIYQLRNTTVSLLRGSILEPPTTIGRRSAAAYSVKLNLSPPFREKSVDFQLRAALGTAFELHLSEEQESIFQTSAKSIASKGYWIVDIDEQYTVNRASIYLVAGISAKPKESAEAEMLKARKPKIIRSAIRELCQTSSNQNIDELFLTVIGTGAAAVDQGKAIDALLAGVNDAAAKGVCPEWVTVVLWPSLEKADKEKEAQRKANWFATGELFRTALASESIYEKDLQLWDYRRPWILASQVCLICAFPFLSALVALRRNQLPVDLTFGAVIGKVLKWGIIGAGVTISQQSFGDVVPLSPGNVTLLCILAFFLPFWDWHKFGEPRELPKNDKNGSKNRSAYES